MDAKPAMGVLSQELALKNVTETMLLADLVLCMRQVKPFLRSWEKQVTAVQNVNH